MPSRSEQSIASGLPLNWCFPGGLRAGLKKHAHNLKNCSTTELLQMACLNTKEVVQKGVWIENNLAIQRIL